MKLRSIISLGLLMTLSLLTACSSQDTDLEIPAVTPTPPPVVEVEPPIEEDGGDDHLTTPNLDDPETTPPVVDLPSSGDIDLSRSDFTLFGAGESHRLTVSNLMSTDTVTYTSSDDTIATVGEDGTVTAVAPGTATITADVLLDGITTIQFTAIVRCNFKVAEPAILDYAAFFQALVDAELFQTPMIQGDETSLTYSYPNLGDFQYSQMAIYMPMMSSVPYELALIQAADVNDVNGIVAMLQARIDAQVAGGAWYPATIEGWEKDSRIVTHDSYIIMVVGDCADDVVEAFKTQCELLEG